MDCGVSLDEEVLVPLSGGNGRGMYGMGERKHYRKRRFSDMVQRSSSLLHREVFCVYIHTVPASVLVVTPGKALAQTLASLPLQTFFLRRKRK